MVESGASTSVSHGVNPIAAKHCSLTTWRSISLEPRIILASSGTMLLTILSISAKLFSIKLLATCINTLARKNAALFLGLSI